MIDDLRCGATCGLHAEVRKCGFAVSERIPSACIRFVFPLTLRCVLAKQYFYSPYPAQGRDVSDRWHSMIRSNAVHSEETPIAGAQFNSRNHRPPYPAHSIISAPPPPRSAV